MITVRNHMVVVVVMNSHMVCKLKHIGRIWCETTLTEALLLMDGQHLIIYVIHYLAHNMFNMGVDMRSWL